VAIDEDEGVRSAEWEIVEGDALDRLDAIEDGSCKLIITSPPYNIGKEYERDQRLSLREYAPEKRERFEASMFLEINSTQNAAASPLKQAIAVITRPFSPDSVGKRVVQMAAKNEGWPRLAHSYIREWAPSSP
jgi:hypothetical protein